VRNWLNAGGIGLPGRGKEESTLNKYRALSLSEEIECD
jgi:hypothetical protein